MGRASTKENKNVYHIARENEGLTREKASEKLAISPDKLNNIENDKIINLDPVDVLNMSKVYKKPDLCNYYCTNQCAIGNAYIPEIKIKDLSQIVLEMIASLNSLNREKDRLIEIAADGEITNDEIDDFISIQNQLEKISITVGVMQLWAEKMISTGKIDPKLYDEKKNRK